MYVFRSESVCECRLCLCKIKTGVYLQVYVQIHGSRCVHIFFIACLYTYMSKQDHIYPQRLDYQSDQQLRVTFICNPF